MPDSKRSQPDSLNPDQIRLELEKLKIDAETKREEFRQGVRKVIFGTMIVGVAVAFFPFAQKLAESVFAERMASIRTEAEFKILKEENDLAKQLETRKHQLESSQLEIKRRQDERVYLETLAEETRSKRIEDRIIIAEFFSFLEDDSDRRKRWLGFREHLYKLQENFNDERSALLAKESRSDLSSADLTTVRQRLDQINRLENPQTYSPPAGLTPGSLSFFETPWNTTEHANCLKKSGVFGVARYIAHKNSTVLREKIATQKEYDTLTAAGLNVMFLFQQRHDRISDFGTDKAKADGLRAIQYIADHEFESPVWLFFVLDLDVDKEEEVKIVKDHFGEINEIVNQHNKTENSQILLGAYGNGLILSELKREKLVDSTWLGMARGWAKSREYFASGHWALNQIQETIICGLDGTISFFNPKLTTISSH